MKSKHIVMFAFVIAVSYLSLLLPKNSIDVYLLVVLDRLLVKLV